MTAPMDSSGVLHKWQFFRAGDFDQVLLRDGADLLALEQLDKKLWATLSCPVKGLEFDSRTLQLIDDDHDGRIRVPEILAAIHFCHGLLKELDLVVEGMQALPLSLIDDSHEHAKSILASAKYALSRLGKSDAAHISVADVMQMQEIAANQPFNGDGIVPASSVVDDELRELVENIIDCVGGETDRSGEPGVSADKLAQFFAAAQARLDWLLKAQHEQHNILPLGDATANAYATLSAVRDKVDDFFVRCRLAGYDEHAISSMNRTEADFALLAARQLSIRDEELATFPLATVVADAILPLTQGINPAWADALAQFHAAAVLPLLGERSVLGEDDWRNIQDKLAPYSAWLEEQAGEELARFDYEQLQHLLNSGFQQKITALIDMDLASKPLFDTLGQVERLVRYVRDLAVLLRNYISFADFYSGQHKAIFQVGTLYLDQRSCDLCVQVNDVSKHAALATLSRIFLVYCDCRRRGGNEKITVAAAMTAGGANGLVVGRNGLFIDRKGNDWDAMVVNVIVHPISIRQAFSDPYKRAARFISEQIGKIAKAKAKAIDDSMSAGIEGMAKAGEFAALPPAPFDVAKFAGIFAAIGLAIGAIGTSLAALLGGMMLLAWWQVPLVFVAIILAISGPSMFIAWLKLRQRNLAPLLDANGWAINIQARINIPFGTSLTALAKLPPGAARSIRDPYAKKRHSWVWYLILLLAVIGGLLYWS